MLRQHDKHFTLILEGIVPRIGSYWFFWPLFWLASCHFSCLLGLVTRGLFRLHGESFHYHRIDQLNDNGERSYHYQI
jgi:hypothetical protein